MMVLVTGANGFIGSSICDELDRRGYKVIAVVRNPGVAPSTVFREVVVDEIGPDTDWHDALIGVDQVIHLAARVHVMRETAGDPDASFRYVNVDGSRYLAEQAAAAGVQRFVYLSSIKVNGDETVQHPFTESDLPNPQDAYGRSKLASERVLFEVANAAGMELVVVRPPLVYGPGVKGNMLRLMNWIERGYLLPLGSINNRRSLIALDNLVGLLIRCLDHPAAAGQVFLASDGIDLSTPDLIRSIAQGLDRKSSLIPFPPVLLRFLAMVFGRSEDARRLVGSLQVDASKAKRILDWEPMSTPDQAMLKMAQWYQRSRQ